ncbi:hypothetical protein Tco_1057155 [Tanacetum coccineum]|uniref:Uncharacterized protein n=1 Tax=Tanacetum coccineum TaxID=301880 RepID=A0ABQ5H4L5_9ASTR
MPQVRYCTTFVGLDKVTSVLGMIRLHRFPRHIFNNLISNKQCKEIWDNVELLMQGSGWTIQQRMEDLFVEFERFRAI